MALNAYKWCKKKQKSPEEVQAAKDHVKLTTKEFQQALREQQRAALSSLSTLSANNLVADSRQSTKQFADVQLPNPDRSDIVFPVTDATEISRILLEELCQDGVCNVNNPVDYQIIRSWRYFREIFAPPAPAE